MQNSEFGIQSESETGRWIGSEWWGVAGRRNLICFFWKIERLVLFWVPR